ncbi:DUF6602 domain-containing protein [Eisenbergiella porci]|uniref:DUF6602 domain-containing protein n=1 Tax=Eisenbergiella porci TaxID=2652274 RepID=UPI002A800953|nr:DUF6602 domain-containing protein [Eisenbergiella porci]
MDIKSLFNTKQTILESKLSVLLEHPVTKGEHCESAWIDFFRSFLPNKYAVDKGFVFDSKGNVSEQIDIIIYDALYAPLIFGTDAGEKFITAESVYAVFESKPTINKETLEYANNKIKSVTVLERSARGVINAGKYCQPRKLTKIIGGILSIDSINIDNIKEYMNLFKSIDLGCAIKNHSFLVNRETEITLLHASGEETVLAFFYIILDELYKLGTVAGIDIRSYANATLDNFKFNIDKE